MSRVPSNAHSLLPADAPQDACPPPPPPPPVPGDCCVFVKSGPRTKYDWREGCYGASTRMLGPGRAGNCQEHAQKGGQETGAARAEHPRADANPEVGMQTPFLPSDSPCRSLRRFSPPWIVVSALEQVEQAEYTTGGRAAAKHSTPLLSARRSGRASSCARTARKQRSMRRRHELRRGEHMMSLPLPAHDSHPHPFMCL